MRVTSITRQDFVRANVLRHEFASSRLWQIKVFRGEVGCLPYFQRWVVRTSTPIGLMSLFNSAFNERIVCSDYHVSCIVREVLHSGELGPPYALNGTGN